MRTFKARGVVLREFEAGESDKRLVLLCKEYGKLTVYARGARKPKSRFLAAAQLFAYGDFVLCDGGTFLSLGQAELIESFAGLCGDYGRLCRAHYVMEVCEKTVLPDTPCDDLLVLLLRTLSRLSKTEEPQQTLLVFMLRFFLCYGLAPEIEMCCVCGGGIGDAAAYFCDDGLLCGACRALKQHKIPITPSARAALAYIFSRSMPSAFAFLVNGSVLDELSQAVKLFWACHFQIHIQTEIN